MEGTQKSHVLVTKVGDYWVTQAEAKAIAEALNQSKYITIEGSMISTFSIDAIVTGEQYKANSKQRNRPWRCKYGSLHTATEPCRCSIALAPPPEPVGELDISPELKAQNAARAQAMREYLRKHLGKDNAKLKDTKARDKFVERRTAEILAEQAEAASKTLDGANEDENATDKNETHTEPQNASK